MSATMLKAIFRKTGWLSVGILPFDIDGADKVSKTTKTAQDYLNFTDDTETGMDRLYMMFSLEYVNIVNYII